MITSHSLIPLALAVVTYCILSTSSIDVRIKRTKIPDKIRPNAIDGKINELNPSNPDTGSHFSCTAKIKININANQKLGNEIPSNEKIRPKISTGLPLYTADRIPIGTAINNATAIPPKASTMVGQARSNSKSRTGLFER
ncbi:hypothetical protein D3C79_895320 [compost metagenome]